MLKESKLKKKKRTTRGKGKKDRMEWALVSKSNPKKVLKWFGPSKPSKKQVAKEERRVHSFASNDLAIKDRLNKTALYLREAGLAEEASLVEQLIKNAQMAGIEFSSAPVFNPGIIESEKEEYERMTGERLGGTTELPSYQRLPKEIKALAGFVLGYIPYVGAGINGYELFLELMKDPPNYDAAAIYGFKKMLAVSGVIPPPVAMAMDAAELSVLLNDISDEVKIQSAKKNITPETARAMASKAL